MVKICLNCKAPLMGEYCAQCGQRDSGPLRFREIAHDFTTQLAEWSLPWPRTLRDLALRPGQTVRDYVAGCRISYVSPPKYAFFVMLIAVAVAVSIFAFRSPDWVAPWRRALLQVPVFLLVMTAVSTLCLRVVYWRSPYSLADITAFSLYMLGQLALLSVVVGVFGWSLASFMVAFGALVLYMVSAFRGFFGGRVDHALAGATFANAASFLVGAYLYGWLVAV